MVPAERICPFILQTAEIATDFLEAILNQVGEGKEKVTWKSPWVINRLPTQLMDLDFTTAKWLTDSGV